MKQLSALQIERLKYEPKLPPSLFVGIKYLNADEGEKTQALSDTEQIKELFPMLIVVS